MLSHETEIRVRYAETDQMGVVYHGVYPQYFEVGRAELIRELGFTYREMEALGIMMPVTELHIRFVRPAKYDELLTLRTFVRKLPEKRIVMETEVINPSGKRCVEGQVTLAFVDSKTGKTIPAPEDFLNLLKAHWKEE